MKRVCLCGVESTGKSTLAPKLATRFGGVALPEYGRRFAEDFGTDFRPEDLHAIAAGQNAARRAAIATAPTLIVEDTDIVMTCVWFEMLFGRGEPALQAMVADADLYLLFDPGVPWIFDGTRMFGSARARAAFAACIEAELARRGIVPVRISGDWAAREAQAAGAIETLRGGAEDGNLNRASGGQAAGLHQ